ncbi:MAG: hypothetical protein AMXMBFR7_38680 [Planctomycetota bacterium]
MTDALKFNQDLDLLDRGEAAVLGGGLAGLTAALTLAEAGVETLLVEERGALGWEVPHGLELYLARGQAVPPALQRIVDALTARNAFRDGTLDPVAWELLMDELVQAAQIRVHFRALAGACDAERGLVRLTTKSGPLAVQANVLVDATENARLARSAGAKFQGAAGKAVSRAFMVCAVEPPAAPESFEVEGLREVLVRPTLWKSEAQVSFVVDSASADRAESEQRFAIAKAVEALRARKPGFDKANLALTAHEAFAIQVPRLEAATLHENLRVAGPSVLGRKPSLQERARLGVEAGTAALERLKAAVAK